MFNACMVLGVSPSFSVDDPLKCGLKLYISVTFDLMRDFMKYLNSLKFSKWKVVHAAQSSSGPTLSSSFPYLSTKRGNCVLTFTP